MQSPEERIEALEKEVGDLKKFIRAAVAGDLVSDESIHAWEILHMLAAWAKD